MGASTRNGRRAAALAAALALVGAAIAQGSGLEQVSERFQVAPGGIGGKRAVCPKGKAAVSAGFSTEVEKGGPLIVPEVTTIFSARRMVLTAENLGTEAGSATGLVYCSGSKPSQVASKSAQVVLDGGETGTAVAKCPEGRALSGSFNTKPDAPVYVSKSRRKRKGSWEMTATNMQNGGVDFEVQVICQRRSNTPIERASQRRTGDEFAFATAHCRPDELLLSGGFKAASPAPPLVYASDRGGKREWGVAAFAEGAEAKLTAYAYCAPK